MSDDSTDRGRGGRKSLTPRALVQNPLILASFVSLSAVLLLLG
ncbi:MAG: hypothetical protein ABR506_07570 [Candidatus Krumholzibacteriia bacterium]